MEENVCPLHACKGQIASCKWLVPGVTPGNLGAEPPKLRSTVLGAHTHLPPGQLRPGALQLVAEKLCWLLHETSSFFQLRFPTPGQRLPGQAGWDAEPIHPSPFGSSPLV